ncbi:MAG: hypothetical protein HJJLKODD_01745 [Phycisphaerae bacterium]|nr:hypothetical protein [Phycisphaerae bacterium]
MADDALNKLIKRKKVGEILIERGLITKEQLVQALETQKNTRPRQLLGEIIVQMGLCTADQIVEALAAAHGIPYARLEPALVDVKVAKILPRRFMLKHHVLPLFFVDGVLTVALSEPTNLYLVEEINAFVEGSVQVVASSVSDIEHLLQTHLPDESSIALEDLIEDQASASIDVVERGKQELVNLEEVASESPVIKMVNYMIYSAVRERASDIHIEPDDRQLRVRYRIDGQLVERLHPPFHMHPALVSRIKIMSSLDISERRLPQDGSIHVLMESRPVDLRISILPTHFGEKVVIRIIDNSTVLKRLDELGMDAETIQRFQLEIGRPHGLLLVTGPTGSGKSTTLYSVLAALERPEVNICTVEDPVEFNLRGINQFQVHDKIDLTFATILRSLLRQDPDIIMVGEMRDHETAVIAVQASLTGHMVFSTLHTNDAPGAITRMYNLGVEPYLVGASLTGVLAQRLVRRICKFCATEIPVSESTLHKLQNSRYQDLRTTYVGRGCKRCNNSGYLGRVGIYEFLLPDDEMRDMITSGSSLDLLRQQAAKLGMKPLFEDGINKVRQGMTTIEEVLRVTLEV